MRHETRLLDYADLLVQIQELCEQSGQLCEESRSLCAESRRQRASSPWPHPIALVEPMGTDSLSDQPVRHQAHERLLSRQYSSRPISAHMDASQHRDEEQALTDQQILDLIAGVLDYLGLEQQIYLLKALCKRTVARTRARLDTKLVRSA